MSWHDRLVRLDDRVLRRTPDRHAREARRWQASPGAWVSSWWRVAALSALFGVLGLLGVLDRPSPVTRPAACPA